MAPRKHVKVVKQGKVPKHKQREISVCNSEYGVPPFLTAPKTASIESWISKIRNELVRNESPANLVLEDFNAVYGPDGHLEPSAPTFSPLPSRPSPIQIYPVLGSREVFGQFGQLWLRSVGNFITPAIPTRPSPMYQLPDGTFEISPIRGAIKEEPQRLVQLRQGSNGLASLHSFGGRKKRRVRSGTPTVLSQRRVIRRVTVTMHPTIKEEPEPEPSLLPTITANRPCSRQPCPMPGCDTVFEAGELNAASVAKHFSTEHDVRHTPRGHLSGFVHCPDALGKCSFRNRRARCSSDLVGFGKHILKIHMKAYGTSPRPDLDD